MIFATPLGLLALLAIPGIIAIHLFRRRFPPRPVAGLFLWQLARRTPEGGGRIARLPVTASLILECLAALALALILAGARLSSHATSQHLVVLLDDSASMAAVNATGERTRDRAVRRVVDEVERLGTSARVTLIRSGDRPSVLAGPAALAVETRSVLDTWMPAAPHHALSLGVRLARELAGGSGRLMVVSDMTPAARGEPEVEGALWASVGEPLPNVGITAAERSLSPDDGRGTVSLTLANHGAQPVSRQLTVTADGKSILTRDLAVPAGASSVALQLPPGLPAIRVQLSEDALSRDNDAVLVEPRPHVVLAANDLPDGRGRQALSKALGSLSAVSAGVPGHLAFVDADRLAQPPTAGTWRVGFGRAPAAWRAAGQPQDFIGPFILEKRHPMLLGITLGGVVWSRAWPLAPGAVRPLVSAGDRVLAGVAAAVAVPDQSILINVDLETTNIIRAPDWPMLISNIVELRRQHLPGPERWNYRIGEWIRVRLASDPKGPVRFRCGTVERTLPAGRLLEFPAPSPGGLLQILDGDTVLFELGVNFLDEPETDLRRQATADAGQAPEAAGLRAESTASSDPLYWLLLAVFAASILLNWCVFTPRGALRTGR